MLCISTSYHSHTKQSCVHEKNSVIYRTKLSPDVTSECTAFISIVEGFAPSLERVAVRVAAPSAMCDSSQGVPVGKRKKDMMAGEANQKVNRVK